MKNYLKINLLLIISLLVINPAFASTDNLEDLIEVKPVESEELEELTIDDVITKNPIQPPTKTKKPLS